MSGLKDKCAIVTGASKGIGRAAAISLAEAGANVSINFRSSPRDAEEVAEICQGHGVKTLLCQADVAVQSEVERIVAETVEHFGRIDVAVSNAAYSDREPFHTANMAGFERTIQVSMWGPYYLLRAVTNQMIKQGDGGAIVVVSSPHATRPIPGSMAYNMAKAAIDHMSRTAATELCVHRIRVNVIHPGWIDTPGERKFFSEELLQEKAKEIAWGRLGRPEEIGRTVVFLADPASDYITGSTFLVDGGIALPSDMSYRMLAKDEK